MISEPEWASIRALVSKLVTQIAGHRGNFITGQVVKRDEDNRLVWIKELGNQPIPIVGLDSNVKYYDTDATGKINVKHAVVAPVVPKVGQSIFVALEMGTQSLPRCIGVIHGKNWITSETE